MTTEVVDVPSAGRYEIRRDGAVLGHARGITTSLIPPEPGRAPVELPDASEGEGISYSYAYPEPDGYRTMPAGPTVARFDEALGEFVLPYTAVRTATDPDAVLLDFLQHTYEAAATAAQWDRAALERTGGLR